MERGLLLGGCGTHAIRLRPSLLFEKRHADEFLTLFEETLSSVWIHYFTYNIIFEITHTPTTRLITVFPNVKHTGPNATDDATLFTTFLFIYIHTVPIHKNIKNENNFYFNYVQQVSISAGFLAPSWPKGARNKWPSVNASMTEPKIQLFKI